MAKGLIRIDPANKVYEIDGKNFGQYCTGAEIKITSDNLPEITLHLTADVDIEAMGEIKALIDGNSIEKEMINCETIRKATGQNGGTGSYGRSSGELSRQV